MLTLSQPLAGAEAKLSGSLTTIHGVKVLTLTGSPHDNGYARGFLMAQEIRENLEVIDALLPPNVDFNLAQKAVIPRLVRTDSEKQEIDGLIEGMRAKLGDKGITLKRIGRPLSSDDIWFILAFPDMHCSAFAAWGTLTSDGGLVVGRNLDYQGKDYVGSGACIVVHKSSSPKQQSWIDFTLSPLPGASTGICQDGRFAAILDSKATGPSKPQANLRIFALRDFVEKPLDGTAFAGQAEKFFKGIPILRGTNFFLCSPKAEACIVEYDGNLKKDSGVTMRMPPAGQNWIAVTNHFRERSPAEGCGRYAKLEKALQELSSSGKKISTLDDAWKIISLPAQGNTLLTIVYNQSKRTLAVSFTDGKKNAADLKPTQFTLDELFGTAPSKP